MPDTMPLLLQAKRNPLDLVLAVGWVLLLLLLSAPLLLSATASIGSWLMACVPLLLTLPGLLHRHGRSLQWLCFLVLFYFTLGVLQAFSPDSRIHWLGLVTSFLCVLLFGAAIVNLRRWRQSGTPPANPGT
jgi:uncharacterized membrane protein